MPHTLELPGAIEASLQLYEHGEQERAVEQWRNLTVQTSGSTAALARHCLELTRHTPNLDTQSLRQQLIDALPDIEEISEFDSWNSSGDSSESGDFSGFLDDLLADDEFDQAPSSSSGFSDLSLDLIDGIADDDEFDEFDDFGAIPQMAATSSQGQKRRDTGDFVPPQIRSAAGSATPSRPIIAVHGDTNHGNTLMGGGRIDDGLEEETHALAHPDIVRPPWSDAQDVDDSRVFTPETSRRTPHSTPRSAPERPFTPQRWPMRSETPESHKPVPYTEALAGLDDIADIDYGDASDPPDWSGQPLTLEAEPVLETDIDYGQPRPAVRPRSKYDRPVTIEAEAIPLEQTPPPRAPRPTMLEAEFFDDEDGLGVLIEAEAIDLESLIEEDAHASDMGQQPVTGAEVLGSFEEEFGRHDDAPPAFTPRASRPITIEAEALSAGELAHLIVGDGEDDPWADVAQALRANEGQPAPQRHAKRRSTGDSRPPAAAGFSSPSSAKAPTSPAVPALPSEANAPPPRRTLKRFASKATPARGTPHLQNDPPKEKIAGGLDESKRLLQQGDVIGGFLLVEQLLKESPEDYEAIYLANTLRERLLNNAIEMLGPLDRAPSLLIAPHELYGLQGLDHRAGYILSQIDGMTPLDFLLDLGAMPRDEAAFLLLSLQRREIIGIP